ncbi:hypothetical protein JTB14_011730 [Gonioctena quinquepunctata]|nr:hypothetical protein JTB14_011730 [Gonioctena quinquepunctata]
MKYLLKIQRPSMNWSKALHFWANILSRKSWKNSNNWEGDVQELSLFQLYEKIQTELGKHQHNRLGQTRNPSTDKDMEINQSLEQSVTLNLPIDLQEIIEPEQIVARSPLEIIQQIDKQPFDRIQSDSSESQSSLNIIQEINEQTIGAIPQTRSPLKVMQDISSRTPVPLSPGNSLKSVNKSYYEPANSKNKEIKPKQL